MVTSASFGWRNRSNHRFATTPPPTTRSTSDRSRHEAKWVQFAFDPGSIDRTGRDTAVGDVVDNTVNDSQSASSVEVLANSARAGGAGLDCSDSARHGSSMSSTVRWRPRSERRAEF